MENLPEDPDNQTAGNVVRTTDAIQLLLQNASQPLGSGSDLDPEVHVIGGSNATTLMGNGEDGEQPLSAEMSAAEAVQNIADMDMSAVDIVTLQPSQMQSMFQIVASGNVDSPGSGGGSFVLSDGHLLQASSPGAGESGGYQSVTLPGGMAALIQDSHKVVSESAETQTVQLEDGTTTVVHATSLQKEAPLSSRLLEGQMIQLEDGTTGLIQAGLDGTDGVQSVTLEDGSTAYISLFGEPPPGALSIDSSHSNHITQSMEVDAISQHQVAVSAHDQNSLVTSQPVIKIEPTSTNTDTTNRTGLGLMGQPHLSERALALGDKAYKCTFENCGRLYTTQHHLKVHERSHTGDKPFRCEFPGCGKAFPTGYGLKSHTRVHTGEKPYRCSAPDCNKAFKTSGDLQKHVRTHTGERPFRCPFEGCDRSFTTSNIRKVHIRTHTGERPYICKEEGCGKSFASATNYKNHIRIHTGEKPYVCTVEGCGKRFTEYSSLYKHHVVHTQSKPYICNHCHKTYRQTSTLAMHKRTVHNDHDMSLDPETTLLGTVGGVQIIGAVDNEVSTERDAEMADGDGGALIINTSDTQLMSGVNSKPAVAPMLTTLQAVPQGSPALLQHLSPANFSTSVPMQQVYLIAHPKQIESIEKNLASQKESKDDDGNLEVQVAVETDTKTSSQSSNIVTVIPSEDGKTVNQVLS